ncbi:nucleosome assembly protein 1/2 isoform X3 [Cinnamomum micranthum f. kanehirae]|uniref:Nucleosome assembly protein 1/2 isoform X3 n=1 Tax=Cinnamomum micranthum f. kanehirae TaxID=337451 RepID=A0A443N274_9MAGN|nr:nucleosome assembly protein 1/2 isoform X3 [Cinnamomum micranthum f. kanehirae]
MWTPSFHLHRIFYFTVLVAFSGPMMIQHPNSSSLISLFSRAKQKPSLSPSLPLSLSEKAALISRVLSLSTPFSSLGFSPLKPHSIFMANNKQPSDLDMSELGSALPAAAAALSAEDRAGLVNALKNKLQHLSGQHSDVLESLTPKVRKRVEVLREIQSQHDELEAKFFEERAALEAKYQKLYEPLYTERYKIVNGVVEVEGVTNEAAEETPTEDKSTEEKGVPDFWLTAMKTNEVLADEISERDEGALKYLKDIKWCRIDDPKGFKLDFFFDPNPYFKNSVLTKTYHMIDDDEPILEKAIGTEIEWFPGKCLTQKLLKKKPRKGSKNAKPITKTEDCESFFNFFNPPQVPEDDDDIDEETAEQLQNHMEQDYDIGSTIRDKIIPHAVSWFTGEAVQGEDFEDLGEDDDEDEDGDEDEEEEEEEDDDEEDDDEEDEDEGKNSRKKVPTRQKKSGAQVGEGQQGERPPECKQQ